ncbi:hypothetical protein ANN_23532 [Periplaneta americana]|uniref:Mos1 transposase HTH domain-containing protein n=1 Tax=Periplaneta americana TaxID=6978 RepID=A0ABQ8SMJ4_PERAM|nr:hypothetical protein ANN_23532 [Periplaneta americana]
MNPESSAEIYLALALSELMGKNPEKPQLVNLSQPGFEIGAARFKVRKANRYSTAVDVVVMIIVVTMATLVLIFLMVTVVVVAIVVRRTVYMLPYLQQETNSITCSNVCKIVDNDGSFRQRAIIKFPVKVDKSAAEIHLRLQCAYGDVCMGASSVRRWVKHFEDRNTSIQDEPRSGRPRTASTEHNKERVYEFWDEFCPDLAPSDYHLFDSLKEQLRGQCYEMLEDIQKAVRQCLREDETDFYSKGILKFAELREKCVQRNGDYVKKSKMINPVPYFMHSLLDGSFALKGIPIDDASCQVTPSYYLNPLSLVLPLSCGLPGARRSVKYVPGNDSLLKTTDEFSHTDSLHFWNAGRQQRNVRDAGLINGFLLLINVLCLQGIPLKPDCRIKNYSLRLSPVDGYNRLSAFLFESKDETQWISSCTSHPRRLRTSAIPVLILWCRLVRSSSVFRQNPNTSGEIICEAGSSCDINKHESNESADRESAYPSISSSSSMDTVLEISNIEELNKSLMSIESPIKKRKLQQNDTPVKSFKKFRNKLFFYGDGLLALRPTPKLEDHPLSAFQDSLFNIFAATLHIRRVAYPSPDIIGNIKSRRLRWAGHVARMGESRNAYRVLVGRPEGKRPLGRPRRRWEDIKMDLREVGYDDRDWINLAQDRDQ